MTFGCHMGMIACPRHARIAVAGTGVMADAVNQFTGGGTGSAIWGPSSTNRFTEGQTDTSSTAVVDRVYEALTTKPQSLVRIRVPKNRFLAGASGISPVLQNKTVEMVFIVRGNYPTTTTGFPRGIPLLWKAPGWNLTDQMGWTTVSSVFVTVNSSTLQVGVSNATSTNTGTTRFVTWTRPDVETICILQFRVIAGTTGTSIGITAQANVNGITTPKTLATGGQTNGAVNGQANNMSLGRGSTVNTGVIEPGNIDWLEFRVHSGALSSANANSNMEYYVSKYLTDI